TRAPSALFQQLLKGQLRAGTKIAQGEFEATVFGMVVVADAEGDVEGIASEKFRDLEAFGHVPAQGVEANVATPLVSSQFSILSGERCMLGGGITCCTADFCAVGVAIGDGCDWHFAHCIRLRFGCSH